MTPSLELLAERLWNRVDKNGDCWLWTGSRISSGYGHFTIRNRQYYTHRTAYLLTRGEIPAGQYVCHRCDVPACCNPDHLFLGTHLDNIADMVSKGRHLVPRNIPKGSAAKTSKLTESQVIDMRRRFADGLTPYAAAREYGVAKATADAIKRGKTWRHFAL